MFSDAQSGASDLCVLRLAWFLSLLLHSKSIHTESTYLSSLLTHYFLTLAIFQEVPQFRFHSPFGLQCRDTFGFRVSCNGSAMCRCTHAPSSEATLVEDQSRCSNTHTPPMVWPPPSIGMVPSVHRGAGRCRPHSMVWSPRPPTPKSRFHSLRD